MPPGTAEYTTVLLPPGGEVLVQTRRDHRYKVLVLVRPWYSTTPKRATRGIRVLMYEYSYEYSTVYADRRSVQLF